MIIKRISRQVIWFKMRWLAFCLAVLFFILSYHLAKTNTKQTPFTGKNMMKTA